MNMSHYDTLSELKQEELRIKSEETKLFREMMAQQTQLTQTLVANMKK